MRKILTYPNRKLLDCPGHTERNEYVLCIADEMIDTMYLMKGVGLAATQIGENLALFVADVDGNPLIAINPTLLLRDGVEDMEEACLSLPGISCKVPRHKEVTLIYVDEEGVRRTIQASGQLAQVFQHEMDHLNGELYWNNLSPLKRNMLRKKYEKIHKYD
jgi:peptide deformylase